MEYSANIKELAEALSKFQGQIVSVKQDSLNPHYKSKYADLENIWTGIRQPLSDNGLSVLQDATTTDVGVEIKTVILHSTGQWIQFGPLAIPVGRKDAHGVGSAITYGKRYAICAALGIVSGDEDDDGNKAQQNAPKPPIKKVETPKVDMNLWYSQMSNNFDKDLLKSYVLDCMVKFEKSEPDTINQLAALPEEKFKGSFSRWSKLRDQDMQNTEVNNV